MKGYVRLYGSKGEGYTVEVYLPQKWLEQFGGGCTIWWEVLDSNWGHASPSLPVEIRGKSNLEYRMARERFARLQDAENVVETTIRKIEAAKALLAQDVRDELREVDLG